MWWWMVVEEKESQGVAGHGLLPVSGNGSRLKGRDKAEGHGFERTDASGARPVRVPALVLCTCLSRAEILQGSKRPGDSLKATLGNETE